MKKLFLTTTVAAILATSPVIFAENLIHSGGKSGDYQPFAVGMEGLVGKAIKEETWDETVYKMEPSLGAAANVDAVCNDPSHTDFGIAQSNMVIPECAKVIQETGNPEVHFMLVNTFVTSRAPGFDDNRGVALSFIRENLDKIKFASAKGSGHLDSHKDIAARLGLPEISNMFDSSLKVAEFVAENLNGAAIFTQRARPDSPLLKFIDKNDDKVAIVPILTKELKDVEVQGRKAYKYCPDQQMGSVAISSVCSPMVIIASAEMDEKIAGAIKKTDLSPAIPVEAWMSKFGRGIKNQMSSGKEWASNLEVPDMSNIKLDFGS